MYMDKIEKDIEDKGFTTVENVASQDELVELRDQLDTALVEDMEEYGHLPGKKEFICYDMVTRGSVFVRLLENEKMRTIFSHFLGRTCILYSFTSTIMKPVKIIEQPTINIHVDAPRLIPGYHSGILMTLAIDDFTKKNGATYYLAGSHKSERKPSKDEFFKKAVRVTRQAGDAVFFNPRVWHAGGKNYTNKTRRACTVYAVRSFMRQRLDYPRMISEELFSTLSEDLKSFLGFDVRVPSSMYEYYVAEEERLYHAGQG